LFFLPAAPQRINAEAKVANVAIGAFPSWRCFQHGDMQGCYWAPLARASYIWYAASLENVGITAKHRLT